MAPISADLVIKTVPQSMSPIYNFGETPGRSSSPIVFRLAA